MYDPLETDMSYQYIIKLNKKAEGLKFAIIGGWGVFLQVKNEYLKAFGREYLKSRDIDIFIDSRDENAFLKIIKEIGFAPSAYNFRYELIYDREKREIITHEKARKRHIFNLIYIFLDIFSDKKTREFGAWIFSGITISKPDYIEGFPVLNINSLLNLKITSFFEREKLDKELKDACDIFALLFYSGKKIKYSLMIKKAAQKIISRPDLQEYIAEQVLNDSLKSGLVYGMLTKLKK